MAAGEGEGLLELKRRVFEHPYSDRITHHHSEENRCDHETSVTDATLKKQL